MENGYLYSSTRQSKGVRSAIIKDAKVQQSQTKLRQVTREDNDQHWCRLFQEKIPAEW